MNGSGDIGLGYSVSSASVYPGIRYTGRLATDPLGTMQQEATLIDGAGVQTGDGHRWGDYSMMTVDPVDDCTFWYTTEYMPTTGTAPWQTRIGAFRFPTCGGPAPSATPTPLPATNTPVVTPTDTATSTPTPLPTDTPAGIPTNTPTSIPTDSPTSIPISTPTSTPTPGSATFALSVSPTSQTVQRPNSASYTVALTSVNGYSGGVNLSVSGLPSRTSATFDPVTVVLSPGGTGTSTLVITTQRSGPSGTFILTVTGSDGTSSHSQNVTLVVTR
jgi:hypothetical protein